MIQRQKIYERRMRGPNQTYSMFDQYFSLKWIILPSYFPYFGERSYNKILMNRCRIISFDFMNDIMMHSILWLWNFRNDIFHNNMLWFKHIFTIMKIIILVKNYMIIFHFFMNGWLSLFSQTHNINDHYRCIV